MIQSRQVNGLVPALIGLGEQSLINDKQVWDADQIGLSIGADECIGCVLCMRVCPAGAIRVRRGVAEIISEICVECGLCMEACPQGCIYPTTTPLSSIKDFLHPVAIASPVLYSQFGYEVTPNQVLVALKRLGFEHVVDGGWVCELNSLACEEYLLAHPELKTAISGNCPSVVRLIAKRFPSLLDNILPVLPPRVLAGKAMRTRIAPRLGWNPDEVGIFHIAPCAATMATVRNPMFLKKSYLDGVICFHEVYGDLYTALRDLDEDETLQKCCGMGISWGMSGGQASAVDVDYTLAVAGFNEVVKILEMLEAGRLGEVRLVEPMICPDGCVGGPMTIENRYRAHSVLRRLTRIHGHDSAVVRSRVHNLMKDGLLDFESLPKASPLPPLDPDPAAAMVKMRRIAELTDRLPGGGCGICGAPDCDTFAHDVILGRAEPDDCPYIRRQAVKAPTGPGAKPMTVAELCKELSLEVIAGEGGLESSISGGYISDLLSDVMANADPGDIWLTIQVHENTVAVAVLKELAAICLTGGRRPQEQTIAKAEAEGVPLLVSELNAFELAGRLHTLGLGASG